MANRISGFLALGLVASLGLNAYLWLRSPEADVSQKAKPGAPGKPGAAAPARSTGLGAGDKVVVGDLDADKSCDLALAECRESEASLERQANKLLPPQKRFDVAAPDPDLEARFKPELARLLSDYDYDLECHTGVCRVEVTTPDGDDSNDWLKAVREDDELRKMLRGMGLGAARPATDPVSGEGLAVHPMYLMAADADAVPVLDVLRPLVEELESSGAIARCASQYPDDEGTLSYRLRIEPDERKVMADYGGDLYATDAGRCIARAQTQILAGADVPEKVTGGTVYHHVTLPLDAESDGLRKSMTASAASSRKPTQATRSR